MVGIYLFPFILSFSFFIFSKLIFKERAHYPDVVVGTPPAPTNGVLSLSKNRFCSPCSGVLTWQDPGPSNGEPEGVHVHVLEELHIPLHAVKQFCSVSLVDTPHGQCF